MSFLPLNLQGKGLYGLVDVVLKYGVQFSWKWIKLTVTLRNTNFCWGRVMSCLLVSPSKNHEVWKGNNHHRRKDDTFVVSLPSPLLPKSVQYVLCNHRSNSYIAEHRCPRLSWTANRKNRRRKQLPACVFSCVGTVSSEDWICPRHPVAIRTGELPRDRQTELQGTLSSPWGLPVFSTDDKRCVGWLVIGNVPINWSSVLWAVPL